MDQVKIGKFISLMRKKQGLTQREFADIIGISDKTVSKWECGNGMPEVSLMLPVCEALKININELFSGEKLTDAEYKDKAEENMMNLAKEKEEIKKNIVGGKVLGQATNIDLNVNEVHKTNTEFWSTIGSDFLGVTALPSYGGFTTENKLNLLGNLTNKKVLEIGCGNGRSLKYIFDRGAADLWGIDISPEQIKCTKDYLSSQEINAKLICSPMENDCGIPTEYFDLVFSVYGIGWSTDLNKTFRQIYSYLKNDGVFIFNWSHPIHKCVSFENNRLIFSNSYFDEDWYSADMGNKQIMLSNRKLSTYINALADNGFVIEKLIEENDDDLVNAEETEYSKKAKMIPVTFVIKARKP